MDKKFLRAKDLVELLNVSESTIHRLDIPGKVKVGRSVLYPADGVQAFLNNSVMTNNG